jgi:hypothetical protein
MYRLASKTLPIFFTALFLLAPLNTEARILTLSDEELATQFSVDFGSGTSTITDTSGPGVNFSVSSISIDGSQYKIAFSDQYEVSSLAGGTGTHNADFTAYSSYMMNFTNSGDSPIDLSLYMNTGFTSSDWKYDTFWGGQWVKVSSGATVTATLDFSNAEAWNIEDDPEYTGYINGSKYPILRLDEVTNIGFQIVSPNDGPVEIVASAVPIPTSVLLLGSGMLGLIAMRRRKK